MNVLVAVAAESSVWAEALRLSLPEADIRTPDDTAFDPSTIEYVVMWRAPVDVIEQATNLVGLLLIGAGYDHLDLSSLPDVPVVRLVDPAMADDIALYVLAWIVHFQRDFDRFATAQADARWEHHRLPRFPRDVTVGVLGTGEIGRTVLQTCAAHGFGTIGWSRSSHDRDLLQFFADCDFVVDLLPLSDSTRGLVGAAELAALGDGVLVNVGRGATVDTDALLVALDGPLRCAVLDVFDVEPLPGDSPLWARADVVITPHVAGRSDPVTAAPIIAGSIRRLARGESPGAVIDRS